MSYGYPSRPENFPLSVGLIGLRDVRDYKMASGGSHRLNTSSPFNIKVSSLTLRDFLAAEVQELYQQHTSDTGQVFTTEATLLMNWKLRGLRSRIRGKFSQQKQQQLKIRKQENQLTMLNILTKFYI